MAYTVRRGKLEFTPNTGNGPCSRRLAGQPFRRVLAGVHVTKGRRHDPDAIPDPRVPPGRLPVDVQTLALRQQLAEAQFLTAVLRARRNTRPASVPGGARRRQARAGAAG